MQIQLLLSNQISKIHSRYAKRCIELERAELFSLKMKIETVLKWRRREKNAAKQKEEKRLNSRKAY
jgi:hypothetical protein